MQSEKCLGCGHSIGQHFQSVDGKVRCLYADSGTTTSGILGIPYTTQCDCVDYRSDAAEKHKEKERRKAKEWDEHMAEIVAAVKERCERDRTEPEAK